MDKEVCTIRIVFPVKNDDEAIEIKKKIKEMLGDTEDVQFHFAIMTPPHN